MTMRQISLGRTGLHVSEMIFGGAPIGGLYAPVNDDQAAAALEAAWTAGIRAFDTAPHYGVGLSEQRIGTFLAGRPRAEFVVSTKVGRRLVAAPGDVEGADGFYGTPQLSRVLDYSRDGEPEAAAQATSVHLDNTLEDYRREIQRRVFG